MALFPSCDREFMRQNSAWAVKERLAELGTSLADLSQQTGVLEAKLVGQDGITLPELRMVTKALWGKEPSEVDELWPSDSTGRITAGRLTVTAAELGISLSQLLGTTSV